MSCCHSRVNGQLPALPQEFVEDRTTADANPITVDLGLVVQGGDYLMVPETQIHGATFGGVIGNVLLAGFDVQHVGGGPVLRTMFTLAQAYGAGTLGIAVALAGNILRATLTGLPATNVHWTIYWTRIQRTF